MRGERLVRAGSLWGRGVGVGGAGVRGRGRGRRVACGEPRLGLHLLANASAMPVCEVVGVLQYGVAPMRLPCQSNSEGCAGPTALTVSGLSMRY